MRLLKVWLIIVACLRMLSVGLGYFKPDAFKERLFTGAPEQVTGVAARSFAMWTLLTCSICLVTANNLCNKQMYYLCMWSFVVADTFFALELFVFQTATFWTALSPFIIATVSIVWMYAERPTQKRCAQSNNKGE